MKTKLFGLVLALCLLAGAFAGMTALAAETQLIADSRNGWTPVGASHDGEKFVVSDGTRIQIATDRGLTTDPNGVYRLTFHYATSSTNSYFLLEDRDSEVDFTSNIPLPATYTEGDPVYKTFTYTFIPGNAVNGTPVTTGFRVLLFAKGGTVCVTHDYDVKVASNTMFWALTDASANLAYANEEGDEVQFITGGEQVTGGARVGEKMMKVSPGEANAMTMEFLPTSLRAKFRGFMKAVNFAEGDTVKVTFYQNAFVKLAEKTYTYSATDENYKDIQNDAWEYFRFSAMPGGSVIDVKFEVTSENGYLYVDGVTAEEDRNLFPDARFVDLATNPLAGAAGSLWEATVGPDAVHAGTDGDCPDGQNYLAAPTGDAFARGTGIFNVQPNQRYLLSFWAKANGNYRILFYNFYSSSPTGYTNNGSAISLGNDAPSTYTCYLASTGGEWKHISLMLNTTANMTQLKFALQFNNGCAISNFSLEPVTEEEIRFFVPDLSDCLQAEPMSAVQQSFMTYLGKPVEVLEDIKAGESVKATCLVPALNGNAHAISTDRMIFASYEIEDGVEKLINIKAGAQAAAGSAANDVAGVNYAANPNIQYNGTLLSHVNYPGATLDNAAFAEADTVRAYCWNSLDGLKAITDFATIR